MTPYTQNLQDCLIDIGKAVEKAEKISIPTIGMMDILFDNFKTAEEFGDMKEMARTSKALLSAIMKWRVEKL